MLPTPIDPRVCVLLVGAGLSVDSPSDIPAAAELTSALVDWLAAEAPDVRPRLDRLLAEPSSREPYLGPFATLRFELLLDWLSYFEPDLAQLLGTLETGGDPNAWHRLVADLVAHGASVLTTNFDTRIEQACADLRVPLARAVVSSWCPPPAALREARLLKLHGTFGTRSRETPVTTLTQIGRFGLAYRRLPRLVAEVCRRLDGRVLVVTGYSWWDTYDVVPLVMAGRPRAVVWHEWSPAGDLRIEAVAASDLMLTEDRDVSAGDVAAGEFAERGTPTFRAAGPTEAFFAELFSAAAHRRARRAAPLRPPAAGAGDGRAASLARLRALLAAPERRVDASTAHLIVDGLEEAYGREPAAAPAPAPDAERGAVTIDQIMPLIDVDRYVDAAHVFVESLLRRDPERTFATNEVAIWILDDMFWRALHARRLAQAQRIAAMLEDEARRRRVPWAQVHADYLRANVAHRSLVVKRASPRRLRRTPNQYAATAVALLKEVVPAALRIPRIDLAVDGLRLWRWLETDYAQQRRLEGALWLWLRRLEPGEERLLAALDLVRFSAWRREVVGAALSDMRETFEAASHLRAGPGYVALAEAFVAASTSGLGAALEELDREIARDPTPAIRDDLVAGREEVHRLARFLAETAAPPRPAA